MEILKIREHHEIAKQAGEWFHSKWGIPVEAYEESINECFNHQAAVPQWYAAVENSRIIAGIGVIENDFHNRKDLRPNICSLYVEEEYRGKKIAGKLLDYVCQDMKAMGISTLYLVTDHTSFYERYGWEFFCMVQEDGGDEEPEMMRMYMWRDMKK